MAMRYLGESFDIHGGWRGTSSFRTTSARSPQARGGDAQALCPLLGAQRFREHGQGQDVESRSANTLTIRDIVKRHDPEALRLWILGTHYRHLLEWSEERGGGKAGGARRSRGSPGWSMTPPRSARAPPAAVPAGVRRLRRAIHGRRWTTTSNTPQALGRTVRIRGAGAVRRRARTAGLGARARHAPTSWRASGSWCGWGRVLGLFAPRPVEAGGAAGGGFERLVAERTERARARRELAPLRRAGARKIQRLGWLVEDTPGGPRADAQERLMAEGRVYGRNPVLAFAAQRRASGGRGSRSLAGGRGPLGEVGRARAPGAGVKVSFPDGASSSPRWPARRSTRGWSPASRPPSTSISRTFSLSRSSAASRPSTWCSTRSRIRATSGAILRTAEGLRGPRPS